MRKVLYLLIMLTVFIPLFGFVQGEGEISLSNAENIAYKYALRWGVPTDNGPTITLFDLEGNVFAYMFNYAYDGSFPSFEEVSSYRNQIVAKIQNTEDYELSQELLKEMWGNGKYAYIIVSANYSNQPVLEMANGLNRIFLLKDKAEQLMISKDSEKVVYISPAYMWLSNNDEYINLFTLKKEFPKTRQTESKSTVDNTLLSKWDKILNRKAFYVKSAEYAYVSDVPYYMWSYGCSPTSSAMIMGYYDKRNHGNLVKYYFDHYDVVAGMVSNVPDVQYRLAIAMDTDTMSGGTSLSDIAGGNVAVPEEDGYSFDSYGYYGSSSDNWEWDHLRVELDEGRPVHWAVLDYWLDEAGDYINHSTVAVGYDISDDYVDTFVIVHNTWDYYEHYWALHTYYDGTTSWDYVYYIHADSGSVDYNGSLNVNSYMYFMKNVPNVILLDGITDACKNVDFYLSDDNWNTETKDSVDFLRDYFVWTPTDTGTFRVRAEFLDSSDNKLSVDSNNSFNVSSAEGNYGRPLCHLYSANYTLIEQADSFLIVGGDNIAIIRIDPYFYPIITKEITVNDMIVNGDYLYVADNNGIYIYDKTNIPSSLDSISYISLPSIVNMQISESNLYVNTGSDIVIYDISSFPADSLGSFAYDYIKSFDVSGDTLFIAAGIRSGALVRYSIADIASPVLIDSISTSSVASYMQIQGSNIFLAMGPNGLYKGDLTVSPINFVDSLDTGGSVIRFNISGDTLISIADNTNGFVFVDNSSQMTEIGYFSFGARSDVILGNDNIIYGVGSGHLISLEPTEYNNFVKEENTLANSKVQIMGVNDGIFFISDIAGDMSFSLYDITGRKVIKEQTIHIDKGTNRFYVNVPFGVYFIKYRVEGVKESIDKVIIK